MKQKQENKQNDKEKNQKIKYNKWVSQIDWQGTHSIAIKVSQWTLPIFIGTLTSNAIILWGSILKKYNKLTLKKKFVLKLQKMSFLDW